MKLRKSYLLILLITIWALALAMPQNVGQSSSGGIIYVDDDNTTGVEDGSLNYPYNTIQEGVNAASGGDTVYVFNGTYYENVVVNKKINLMGEDKENTIIDGGGVGDVFCITADQVNISGFMITNSGSTSGYPVWDAGIDLDSDFNMVYDCNVSNNNADGVILRDSSYNILFGNCVTSNHRAGILMSSGSQHNIIHNSTLASNAFHGFWILYNSNDNAIENNIITNNDIFGVIIVSSHGNMVSCNTISLNKDYGVYIKASVADNKIFHNNIISNTNQAYDEGNNIWDNGYPSGGNYWSDYSGVDYYSGVNQNIPGSDGIGDTPYAFDYDEDEYPLMSPWYPFNNPPVADAGLNQTVKEDEVVQFDSSSSFDPDGTIDVYEWDFDASVDSDGDGNSTNDADAKGVKPTHIYHNLGVYTVTLRVTDNDGASDTDTCVIVVISANQTKVANAGPDQTVNEGQVVQFDGSGSFDPNGTIKSHEWDLDANVDSDGDGNTTNDIDATGPKPTHVYGDDGVYNVTLTVKTLQESGGTEKVDQDVVLIIDSSGSMAWNDPEDLRIDAAKHYVYMLTPDDMVAVVDFDSQTKLLQGLTMNYYDAMVALELIDSSGGTTLSPALNESINELENYGNSKHTWAIILLTDAENLKKWDVDECYVQADRAVADDIIIFTIGLNIDTPQEQKLLQDIANLTGGTYYSPPNASHLYEIYEKISEQVENKTTVELSDTDTMKVTVKNLDPAIQSFVPLTMNEGQQLDLSAIATDPGSDDLTFTWEFELGPTITNAHYNNGVGPDPYPSPLGIYPFSATEAVNHTYGDNGVYTITLTVNDDDGGIAIYMTNITVNNLDPVGNISGLSVGAEGSTITFTSAAIDPGSDDLTFSWNWGEGTSNTTTTYHNDGVGPDPYPSPWGTFPFTATDKVGHTYGDNGVYMVTLTIEDDDGGSTIHTKNVTINNVAPTLEPFGPFIVDEGLPLNLNTTSTDPGSDDLTFTWEFQLGPTITNAYYNDGTGSDPYPSPWGIYPFSVTDIVGHTYGDNGVYTITLTVEDDDGGLISYATNVTVTNVVPTIIPFGPFTTDEGSPLALNANSTDQGSDDLTFTWEFELGPTITNVYYNDGSGPDPYLSPWGTYPFTVTDTVGHTYGDNGVYTLTLTVEDDDGGSNTYETNVTVNNVAPTIESFWPLTVNEGSSFNLSTIATDSGSDDLTFSWEFEFGPTITNVYYNDGAGPDPYPSPWGVYPFTATGTVNHTYGDNGVYTVTLTVEDDDGGSITYAINVTVNNVAPSIEPFGSFTVDEGMSFNLTTTSTDPGSDDLTFTWEFQFGPTITKVYYNDGTGPDPYPSPWGTYPFTVTDTVGHIYGDNGVYTITLTLEDDDGASTTYTTNVTVNNVAPTIEPFILSPIDEGSLMIFTATSTDQGSDDLTFTWSWGDGTSDTITTYYNDGVGPDPYPSPWGTYPFTVTDTVDHPYGDNGVFLITLTVDDDDGASSTYTTNITVNNIAPTIEPFGPIQVDEGSPLDTAAKSTDPGSDDLTFSWEFEYGPMTTSIYYNNGMSPDPYPSPWGIYPFTVTDTVNHTYGDNGVFMITLTVEDDDGGSTTYSTNVTVNNVAPSVDIEAYMHINLSLRIAGEKWHSAGIYILEDGSEIYAAKVTRYPGSPDKQKATLTSVKIDMTNSYTILVDYLPNDPKKNGNVWGANPVWIDLTFEDGSVTRLHHTFNVRQSYWQSDHWNHIDPWKVDLAKHLVGHKITFEAIAIDPGSDDLTFTWNWGDGTPDNDTTYYNDGLGPDPCPSPWGTYPFTAIDVKKHTYTIAGNYTVTLAVTDDDGGIAICTMTIKLS